MNRAEPAASATELRDGAAGRMTWRGRAPGAGGR